MGEEGFITRSVSEGGTKCLVLLGSSHRGTLYAVYHYLEKFCRVGFFADGERVPKLDEIPIEGIDVVERPRWPVRQYMIDCEYTSYWWGWDEWKREVDWAAKRRLNVLSSNFDFTATWRRVWKRFGVNVPATSLSGPPFHPWAGWHNWAMRPPYPEGFQDFQAELAKEFTDYGRRLGIKMAPDFRGFIGQVPREFYEACRDRARFIEVGWGGFDPPGVFIHPDDPLSAKVAKAYAEEYTKEFGTDRLWACQTYCEMRPGNPYGIHQCRQLVPHLQKALEIALEESARLGDSPLYQHDLIDIARQFLSDLFNLHVARLARAFRAQDEEAFEREARLLRELLTSQEMLLSSSEDFCLAPILAKAKALRNAPEDFEERIRDILTIWAGKILDYAHRDYYELVRFYYRRRVEAFIQHARARLGKRSVMVSDKELAPVYHEPEQAWVKKPFKVARSEKHAGTPAEAVAELLKRHRLSEEELKKLATETFAVPPKPFKPGEYSLGNDEGYRIKASSCIGDYRPGLAIDGDLDTAWWGYECPQWCQIDLGAVRKVSELNIVFHYRDRRYYQYRVPASEDETKWQAIVDETKNTDLSTAQGKTNALKPPVDARYLRLTVTYDSADPCAHGQEIRVKVEGGRR